MPKYIHYNNICFYHKKIKNNNVILFKTMKNTVNTLFYKSTKCNIPVIEIDYHLRYIV